MTRSIASPAALHEKCGSQLSSDGFPWCHVASRNGGTIVRNRQFRNRKFRRDYPIPPYTVDFCCVALRLVVEIDGSTIKPNKAARMMNAATEIWPKEDTRCYGYRDTKCCEMRLACDV